jgi:hypothetical protein
VLEPTSPYLASHCDLQPRRAGCIVLAMRSGLCAVLALSACYAPNIVGGAPCDPGRDSCPSGQTCEAVGSGYFCTGGRGPDDGGNGGDSDAGFCLGGKLLGSVCLASAPTMPLAYAATTTINTAQSSACTETRAQTGGPSYCLIAATTIDIPAGATLRAIGPNPLVLFASGKITIQGTLDAASHVGDTLDLKPVPGAGARTTVECNALGVDGTSSNDPAYGGGGGAGGSFGGVGGAGGNGRGGVAHGNPRPASSPTVLVGGCQGGHGGDGAGGGGGGAGGLGGGAIYVLAGESITVSGKLNSAGAGGGAGGAGLDSSGAGGGGGAGGMIGLEAPHIDVTGTVIANGGGGGGGGGDQYNRPGSPGQDPQAPATPAPGGGGGSGGGAAGGAGSTAPLTGASGIAVSGCSNGSCAGGGGGGGGGIVHFYGTTTMVGSISPPPT